METTKKIFLTEEQIDFIQKCNDQSMLNEGFFKNYYNDCKSFEDYFKMTMVLIYFGIGTVGGGLVLMNELFPEEFAKNKNIIVNSFNNAFENRKDNGQNNKSADFSEERKNLKQQQISEIDNLMRSVAELNGRDPNQIELSAEHIVNMCNKYNFPIPLLLAQAHLESHFGTTSRAQKTNSVFSVGSYDDGRNVYKPSTQNESIENYILTIQNYYLKDKTIDELLANGGFVNFRGHRYASDKNYELKIRQTMNGIIKKYCPSCF